MCSFIHLAAVLVLLWLPRLQRLLVAALPVLGSPCYGPVHPTQTGTCDLCPHPAWVSPLVGWQGPLSPKTSLCHPQTLLGSCTGFSPREFMALCVLQDGLLKPAYGW